VLAVEVQQLAVAKHLEFEALEVSLTGGEKFLEGRRGDAIDAQDDVSETHSGDGGRAVGENLPDWNTVEDLGEVL